MATTLPNWLAQRASLSPEATAVEWGAGSISFARLEEKAGRMAASLAAAGVQKGDHIAFWLGNSPEFIVAVHACARLGVVVVPLNLRLAPTEVHYQLRTADVTWLLTDDPAAVTLVSGTSAVALHVAELPPADGDVPAPPIDLSVTQAIIFTSGTTGRPKGAMLTYGNHWWSAIGSVLNLGLAATDKWLAVLPLFHVGGLSIVWRSVIYGIPVVLHPRFDVAAVHRAVDEGGITVMSAVSNMVARMLDERGGHPYPDTLRCVLVGGGPVAESLLHRAQQLRMPVVQTYGLTETASQVVTLAPQQAVAKLGSAGKPLFPVQLRLENDGEEAARNEAGEIVVHGPSVMKGYYGDEPGTAAVLRDGWLRTGDIGYLDDDGYLFVLDRRDDMFVSGGENVYPAEIEAVLQKHAQVAEAAVIGVKDDEWGQVPAAFVVLREGPKAAAICEQVIQHCRGHLAPYKVPRYVNIVAALPRNATGKLLRRQLRTEVKGK